MAIELALPCLRSHSALPEVRLYTDPFVSRWHVFAMPPPGYAGYLAFGLECLFIAELVRELLCVRAAR